ncbi:hypothetical protein USB125703_00833 [Pseudoclavibacter triregionum]|nr:hypothetical protein USB125703_00833 [Pseudoclavibacter triregionum]
MATLYVREVPEEVAAVLKERAAAQNQSLSAYVNTQLAMITARPSNAEIVERLRTRVREPEVTTERILDEVQAGRR